jgi:hypothetical protein
MPFIQTGLAQSQSASPKATTLYVYNMSLFLVACLLNRCQRASRARCLKEKTVSVCTRVCLREGEDGKCLYACVPTREGEDGKCLYACVPTREGEDGKCLYACVPTSKDGSGHHANLSFNMIGAVGKETLRARCLQEKTTVVDTTPRS